MNQIHLQKLRKIDQSVNLIKNRDKKNNTIKSKKSRKNKSKNTRPLSSQHSSEISRVESSDVVNAEPPEIDEKSESLENDSNTDNQDKNEYSYSFNTKTRHKRRVVNLFKHQKMGDMLTTKEIEEEEDRIDRKTINMIFKLKNFSPDLFDKALEYLRIGARKKRRLYNLETREQQMARLYPENQPKVFSRLWGEVDKRRK